MEHDFVFNQQNCDVVVLMSQVNTSRIYILVTHFII